MTDWAKRRPWTLRLADRLGRGRGRARWLDRLHRPLRVAPPDLSDWQTHELAACCLGHATVLLRLGGKTILTDPVFSNRIGISLGLLTGGPLRLLAPALSLRQLPPIDLILISHAHFDHLDRPTLARLPKHIPVVTAHNSADLIRDLGFQRITELAWGQSVHMGALTITAAATSHWGARLFFDRHRGFNAYLMEVAGRRVLYGGDSAYGEHFRPIGKVDLAIFGIGAYNPYIQAHATPEQAWDMAHHVQADYLMPMHHSTFRLSHEPMSEPLERMERCAAGQPRRLAAIRVGECWSLPNIPVATAG